MLCIGDIYSYSQIRIDFGTGQRMCIYERAGTGLEDVTMSVDPSAGGACQRSYACDPLKN